MTDLEIVNACLENPTDEVPDDVRQAWAHLHPQPSKGGERDA